MAFPPVHTFIGFPYPATPTAGAGTSGYRDIYWPISQLVDGSGATGWRSANTTGSVILDLGASLPCNYFACFGHNFDNDMVTVVEMSNSSGISPTLLSRGCSVRQPSFWLDLRDLAGTPTTARYLRFSWAGNSRMVTLGELSLGLATGFRGTLNAEPVERTFVPQLRSYLDYGKLIVSSAGVMGRTMDLVLNLDPDQRAALDTIAATAATSPLATPGSGTRVVVIPSSHRNDAWLVEWPAMVEGSYDDGHDRIVQFPITLVEEIFAAR